MKTASKYLYHTSCSKCGSSDANAVFDDNHSYCYACNTYNPCFNEDEQPSTAKLMTKLSIPLYGPDIKPISSRNITRQTCETFKVSTDEYGNIYQPYYNNDGQEVGQKVKSPSKDFRVAGDIKQAILFGQQLFPKGGKYVTIYEGELDCLAGYQMTGSKWPSVSIKNGAAAALKNCKEQYEWLDSFENIVICFDADEPGQKAAKEVAELFGTKAKVFKHSQGYKDACDYLKDNKGATFVDLWWRAEEYRPEGIVTVDDIFDRMLVPPVQGKNWCFDTLTRLTYGRRPGELYAFGAGVGIGKTDVFTQQIAYDIDVLNEKVGVIYLEQNVVETAQRVAGKLDKKLYHVPDANWTREEYVDSATRLKNRKQLYMMEHFGAMKWSSVKNIIKYFSRAYDIKLIYLDHLTALSANEDDERRALDGIMADMAGLAQSDGLIVHFVSHLTTPDGKPHEEGGRVMEKHFTGSRAIARWSHYMFGLERDKQHEDPIARQTTTFRVLKDRFTGRATAEKFGLFYNKDTGILTESPINHLEEL